MRNDARSRFYGVYAFRTLCGNLIPTDSRYALHMILPGCVQQTRLRCGPHVVDPAIADRAIKGFDKQMILERRGAAALKVWQPAALVKIPKYAKTLDYTGTYILPGLVDGFAGLNSQEAGGILGQTFHFDGTRGSCSFSSRYRLAICTVA